MHLLFSFNSFNSLAYLKESFLKESLAFKAMHLLYINSTISFQGHAFTIKRKSLVFKAMHLLLTKLQSPSPKDALCQVWLKLAQWLWRRRYFKFRQCIFAVP